MLSFGDITVGRFVAAEVIVETLLLNLDVVARRMYVATSLDELSKLFRMPKEDISSPVAASRLIFNGSLQYRVGTPADLVAQDLLKGRSLVRNFRLQRPGDCPTGGTARAVD